MGAFDNIRQYVNQAKGVLGIGDQAVEASNALRSAAQAAHPPAVAPAQAPYEVNALNRVHGPRQPIPGEQRIPDSVLNEWRKPLGGLSEVRK